MKKTICAFLICMMSMLGCSAKKTEDPRMNAYETYYHAVEDNVKYVSQSTHFHYSTEMTDLPDGTHRYYIVIDEPQHAMYQCAVLAVENEEPFAAAKKMMPSMGIQDDPVSMIPNQVNIDKGFVKGIALSGESSEASVKIRMLVEWKDRTAKNTTREFLEFRIPAETGEEVPAPEEGTVNE